MPGGRPFLSAAFLARMRGGRIKVAVGAAQVTAPDLGQRGGHPAGKRGTPVDPEGHVNNAWTGLHFTVVRP